MSEEQQVDADVEALAERIEIEINALQVLREQISETFKKIEDFEKKLKEGKFDDN